MPSRSHNRNAPTFSMSSPTSRSSPAQVAWRQASPRWPWRASTRAILVCRKRQHAQSLHERRRRPGVLVADRCEVQACVLECASKVVPEHVRVVVLVQRKPGGHYALSPLSMTDVRQRGRLAEAAGRLKHRQPPLQHPVDAPQQRCGAYVVRGRRRRNHSRAQQPLWKDAGSGGIRVFDAAWRHGGLRRSRHREQRLPGAAALSLLPLRFRRPPTEPGRHTRKGARIRSASGRFVAESRVWFACRRSRNRATLQHGVQERRR